MYTKKELRRKDTVLKAVKGGIKKKYEDFTSKLSVKNAGEMARYVSLEYISNNPQIEWSYWEMSNNTELTIDFVFSRPDKDWNIHQITSMVIKNEAWAFVDKNIDWKWSFASLSTSIPLYIIDNNPHKAWNWSWISTRYDLTEEFILRHPDKSWETIKFSNSFSKDLVISLHYLDWDWFSIELKTYFHWDIVRAHPQKHWDWVGLSTIKNIPSDVFLDNMEKSWSIRNVCKNIIILEKDRVRIREIENIELKYMLIGNDLPLDDNTPAFDIFSGPGGEKREQEMFLYHARRHIAAIRIQKIWTRVAYDEKHPIGERIQLRKFFNSWESVNDPKEIDRLVEDEIKRHPPAPMEGEPI